MRRSRLRWRLARSHALLAIVLVGFAGNRIGHEAAVAQRAEASTVAVRDSEVLALRAGRLLDAARPLQQLVGEEESGDRDAEIMSADGIRLAGTDLVAESGARATIDSAIADGGPAFARGPGSSVIAASPIVVDGRVAGAAVVSEAVHGGLPSLLSLGLSTWLGLLVVLVAAGAGWIIAGRISRPISALTDDMRQLALGPDTHGDTSRSRRAAAFPEIETLTAAVQGIAARDTRRTGDDDERRATLRALSHRLSHQLRTPLTVLRLRVDDLADDDLSGERRTALADVVATQIDRLDRLGRDLAELDPARWELRSDVLDIAALTAEVVDRNAPLARWGGVTIEFAGRTGPDFAVLGDVAVLDDALANIVQNAIKYTPRGGRITATVSRRGAAAVVTVRDTGVGIKPAERELVLRSGVRGHAAALTEGSAGSGHGLGLVVDAAQRHGGHIELTDTPGGGATVRFVVPLAVWEAARPAGGESARGCRLGGKILR